jgi:hypothetical protein
MGANLEVEKNGEVECGDTGSVGQKLIFRVSLIMLS